MRGLVGLVASFLLFAIGGMDAEGKVYTYKETKGDRSVVFSWELEKGDRIRVTVRREDERFVNILDASGATWGWEVHRPRESLVARREGNAIFLAGQRKGEAVRKEISIDEAPWYQPLSYSLGKFSGSDKEEVEFWIVRPDKLSPVRMRAEKKGVEEISLGGSDVKARKVRVSLDGMLSKLWHAHCWYRAEDGIFLQYEGRNGPPGTPVTRIRLLKDSES